MYGYTTPYKSSDAAYTGEDNPLPTSNDAAYSVNTAWRMPTQEQFEALYYSGNTSLLLAAAGFFYEGSRSWEGVQGYNWSSTPYGSTRAYVLTFTLGEIATLDDERVFGFSVRPVKNKQAATRVSNQTVRLAPICGK